MLDAHMMFFKMVLKRPRKNMLKSITQNAEGHRDSWYSAMQLCKVLQTIFLTVLKAGDRSSLQDPKQRQMDILGWSHSLRSTAPPHSHLTSFHHPLPVTILFLNNELLLCNNTLYTSYPRWVHKQGGQGMEVSTCLCAPSLILPQIQFSFLYLKMSHL